MLKDKIWGIVVFIGYTFFLIGTPILLIWDTYNLQTVFKDPTPYKLSSAGLIIAIITAFYIRKQLFDFIQGMKENVFKFAIIAALPLIPVIIIYSILGIMEEQIFNYIFIVKWTLISWIIAVPFNMLVSYYRAKARGILNTYK